MSVSLDEDLVEALAGVDAPLSTFVNEAVRVQVEHETRQRLLEELVDELTASHGAPDEDLVASFMESLD